MFKRLIVWAYKVMGFVVLAMILLGLLSYILLTAFYYVSSSWATPVIVSPSDRRVLELNAQLAEQQTLRGQLQAQQVDMILRLHDAQRIVTAERAFQASLRSSLALDLAERRATIGELARQRRRYDPASAEIIAANEDFAGLSRDRIKELFGAHLVNRDELVKGNAELAAIAETDLVVVERRATLDEQLRVARRQLVSMSAADKLLSAPPGARADGTIALSHDALAIYRDYGLSILAEARARENADALEQSIAAASATLARYDALLSSIKAAPYLRAADHHLTIAFVPYENVAQAKLGASVYACRAHVIWCRKVGKVGAPLEGEVTGQDPLRKLELRGVMMGIELDEMRSAREAVLHLGSAPLFL